MLNSYSVSEDSLNPEIINIKVKLKSKLNPRYIKLLGMAQVSTSGLTNSATSKHSLYQLKRSGKNGEPDVMGDIPIGSINLETALYQQHKGEEEKR